MIRARIAEAKGARWSSWPSKPLPVSFAGSGVGSTPTRFRHSCLESRGGKRMRRIVFLLAFAVAAMAAVPKVQSQQRGAGLSQEVAAKRVATEKELESVAVIGRKLLVPMRDAKRMATD